MVNLGDRRDPMAFDQAKMWHALEQRLAATEVYVAYLASLV